MRFDSLELKNFLGTRDLALTDLGSLVAVFGPNESGKSTIAQAMRWLRQGDPGRVSLKRDYWEMVTRGQKKGFVRGSIDGAELSRGLPSGAFTGVMPQSDIPHSILFGGSMFSSLTVQQRRKLLIQCSSIEVDKGAIKRSLEEACVPDDVIKHLAPLMPCGCEAVAEEARSKARELKAEWKIITRENWGAEKAESWGLDHEEAKGGADAGNGEYASRHECPLCGGSVSWDEERTKLVAAHRPTQGTANKASQVHERIKGYLEVGEICGPSGMEFEAAQSAIEAINVELAMLCQDAGWKPAQINRATGITWGGLPLSLCAESAHWRANALIAICMAISSGARIAVLDGADILEKKHRGALLRVLSALINDGRMDQIWVMATTDKKPKMPDSLYCVWLGE